MIKYKQLITKLPAFYLVIRLLSKDLKRPYPNTGDPGLQGKRTFTTFCSILMKLKSPKSSIGGGA